MIQFVTFLSLSWRSLNLWKGSLNHLKKVTNSQNCQAWIFVGHFWTHFFKVAFFIIFFWHENDPTTTLFTEKVTKCVSNHSKSQVNNSSSSSYSGCTPQMNECHFFKRTMCPNGKGLFFQNLGILQGIC